MAVKYHDTPIAEVSRPAAVRVLRIDPGDVVICRMLSAEIGGLFTHFCQKRSRYCSGETCNPVYHRTEQIWKGYCAAERWRPTTKDWLPVVLELTEHAELELRGIYARGQVWEFRRPDSHQGKGHQPVQAAMVSSATKEVLRPAFDVRIVLTHLYHATKIDLSSKNPLPPRLILSPIAAGEDSSEGVKR